MRAMTKLMKLTIALAASAVGLSAPAAAADYYLTFGDVKPAAGGKVREAAARSAANTRVEVMSWSFGASQTSHAGGGMGAGKAGTGMGAGKANFQDISIIRANRAAADNDGDGPGTPVVAAGDINGDGRANRVAAVDLDGDGRADRSVESPGATVAAAARKRAHQPVGRGSVTLTGTFPACTVGAAYKDAALKVEGASYTFNDITVTRCATAPGATGGDPAQSLSFNYSKITVDY